MKPIRVLPVGAVDRRLIDVVRQALAREFRTTCMVADSLVDPAFAYHPERSQYHSTALLEHLSRLGNAAELLVGVTAVDLYIPILTFVFGEAQVGGAAAVVSYHRLQQQFYGLEADDGLLQERLAKEAIHEVGHIFGLHHCDDYECVMATSHAVEWLDLKGAALCGSCRGVFHQQLMNFSAISSR
jgi:archaemetzincin